MGWRLQFRIGLRVDQVSYCGRPGTLFFSGEGVGVAANTVEKEIVQEESWGLTFNKVLARAIAHQ